MSCQLGGQAAEDGTGIVQSNSPSLEPRYEPNTQGTVARSSTQQVGAVAYHFLQHQASLLSQGRDIFIIYNEGNVTLDPSDLGEKKFAICNAPGGRIDIYSKDPSTPSQNLGLIAPGKSLSQIDLTADVPRSHDNQEAPRITLANSHHPPIDLRPNIPHGHEDSPEAPSRAPQTGYQYAILPQYRYAAPASTEPAPIVYTCGNCNESSETKRAIRSHQSRNTFLCKDCECFPSRIERDRHIRECHITCYWCAGKFASDGDLNRHFEKKHLLCDQDGCEEWCRSQKDLTKHKADIHPRCHLCEDKPLFPSRQARDSHLQKNPLTVQYMHRSFTGSSRSGEA